MARAPKRVGKHPLSLSPSHFHISLLFTPHSHSLIITIAITITIKSLTPSPFPPPSQHFGKLLKEFPGTIPAIDGEARGTKRKADQEGDEGASADAGSDEPVTPEKPKKAAAKAKATPKAKKDTDGAKGKTASARGGKAAGTGRGGKKAKKEAVIAEKETVDAKKGAVDATKEVIDEEGTEDAPGEIVEKGTFIAKEDEAKQDDGGEQHEEL